MNNNGTILVVDDEVMTVNMIQEVLTQYGYGVISAQDGTEALEKVQKMSPDVILLDLMMPKVNGLEVTRILKRNDQTMMIPIIMITGKVEVNTKIEALQAGVEDFLRKPLDISELIARVKSLIKVKAYFDQLHQYQKELESTVAQRTEELRNANTELKNAYLDIIYRLSRAAEYRDELTGFHLQRISNYAAALAHELKQSEKTIDIIMYSAPMHDIGKIGVPDHILLKKGKLNTEEWEIMKQHTTIGARILKGSSNDYIRIAEIIALTHHEKWDGTGYPHGLKKQEIPLIGQIVSIADVFDALTTKRPYKEAYSLEKSFEIIAEGRGRHFSNDLVDAFFTIKSVILYIRKRYIVNELYTPI